MSIINWFLKLFSRKGCGISFLIPFHCPDQDSRRAENWRWLKEYWKCQLPGAEIVMGFDAASIADPGIPFSKSCAVNNAASKAHGDIFVIVDADGYVTAEAILICAHRIRKARKKGRRLWFVPYRQFFRLTERCSRHVLESNPYHPKKFSTPPPKHCIQNTSGSQHGHWFGALIQIVPREAFCEVGGWDPRFRGWGGEDHAAMEATDTLYWHHKTLPGQVLHLWHPMLGPEGLGPWVDWQHRMWPNQKASGNNDHLSRKYYGANGHPRRMRKLVNEGLYPE